MRESNTTQLSKTGQRQHAMNSSFRPDIEGLRAVAVLLVIAAHFDLPGFSGGFIGVDIFFVISGFLITGILLREQSTTGTIALGRFYARRLRRLLPALATMLVVTSLLTSYLLHESQYQEQGIATAMAVMWLSNIYFTFSDVDYFAEESTSNAMLHTWSLGVEEQFYLIWPLAILLIFRYSKGRSSQITAVRFFTAITVISFCACMLFSVSNPQFSFYMMPTRAWQFSAGALVWLLSRDKSLSGSIALTLGGSGVLLLLGALVIIEPDSVYPSALALLPTLATCLLLWAGSTNRQTVIGTLLALQPMQRLGRLSYSWYLWHWPVLIIGEQLAPIKGHLGNTLLALAVSLFAAKLTYALIENPIRYGSAARIKTRWQIALAVFTMLLLNAQFLKWQNDTQSRLATANHVFVRALSDVPTIYKQGCDSWYQNADLNPCIYGKKDAQKTAVLLGDSIGAQWFPALERALDPTQWRLIVLTKSSCPMVDEPYFYARIGREYTECAEWRAKAIAWLRQQSIDRLFIGSTASNAFSDEQWQEGTRRILDEFAHSAKAIYLLEANPTLRVNGPQCLMRHDTDHEAACQNPAGPAQYTHVAELLRAVAEKQPNTYWLPTSKLVCPDGQCQAMRDGTVVYRDAQHLTASFVTNTAPYFLEQIQRYEKATQ